MSLYPEKIGYLNNKGSEMRILNTCSQIFSTAFKDENKESIVQICKHLTRLNDGEVALESLKIPYHAGAVKFWQDNGITIPDYL